MKKKKVIHPKNFVLHPMKIVWSEIILYLFLDKLQASQIVYGVVGTFLVLMLIVAIVDVRKSEYTDIFNDNKEEKK